ncbi:hypothetical protein ABH917_001270 [Thermobifida halotolerans]|uniref:hypothetical protein n=1 Tax=Thermobifida halotolerans TaxID=483545 RepID=UPI00359A6C03
MVAPLVVPGADRAGDADFAEYAARLRNRLRTLETEAPVAFRHQNRGDYDDDLVLRPHLAPGRRGLGVHRAE